MVVVKSGRLCRLEVEKQCHNQTWQPVTTSLVDCRHGQGRSLPSLASGAWILRNCQADKA